MSLLTLYGTFASSISSLGIALHGIENPSAERCCDAVELLFGHRVHIKVLVGAGSVAAFLETRAHEECVQPLLDVWKFVNGRQTTVLCKDMSDALVTPDNTAMK